MLVPGVLCDTYSYGLKAQPGGSVGRAVTTPGSWPISVPARPLSVDQRANPGSGRRILSPPRSRSYHASYDPVGSRTMKLTGGVTTTYSYNAGDAVTGADAGGTLTTYLWDDAGNNTVVNANGSLTTYTWDGENRLKTIQTAAGTITVGYDAGGLRRTRQDASATRKYVWDFQNLLPETDGDGTTVAQYTGALDTYGPIVSQRRSTTSRFYHRSVLGTIETLTGADAATTDTYILDAWGVQHAATGSTTNPFRYIGALGYYTEPDLGLAYVRARWLRPGTGSWLSVDAVEGEQRYAYVHGLPTMWTDASGLLPAWLDCLLLLINLGLAVVTTIGICAACAAALAAVPPSPSLIALLCRSCAAAIGLTAGWWVATIYVCTHPPSPAPTYRPFMAGTPPARPTGVTGPVSAEPAR